MEKEITYLRRKIHYLDGQLKTLEDNKNKFNTIVEYNYWIANKINIEEEREIYRNILHRLCDINKTTQQIN